MSTPTVIRAAQNFLRRVNRISYRLTKELVGWFLRGLLVIGRQPLLSKAGFVLPTTVLLLLVVMLTVGAIGYRTFTRTQQAITERQQQVIYNAATPVIDRARNKVEFLMDLQKETRGIVITPQEQLKSIMLNDGKDASKLDVDSYTFKGETRLDINGGGLDNAWRYRIDLDGDGNTDTPGKDGWAVYSIIFDKPKDVKGRNELEDTTNAAWEKRAKALLVRNAPLSNSNINPVCQRDYLKDSTGPELASGWFRDPNKSTKLRKNFQINAYVVPDNSSGTVATLELQQDREATQGFKWAAWFRNDLEIYPGPTFNWNGAMHTEGNLIIGEKGKFKGYLVSSLKSCVSSPDASEITSKENEADKPIAGTPAFKGRFITGTIRDNDFEGNATFDISNGGATPESVGMSQQTDSVAPSGLKPLDFSLEPVTLQTKGQSIPRNSKVKPTDFEDGGWKPSKLNQNGQGRLYNTKEGSTPYVDDTFRADNRWGPKPIWGRDGLPIGVTDPKKAGAGSTVRIGEDIVGVPELTGSDPTPGTDNAQVGFDGYWERRARVDGLRLIVGQRLELGDPAGWGGPGSPVNSGAGSIDLNNEPLRPWLAGCSSGDTCNEERQRKTLWDNLAAVQATAVYHNATDATADTRDFPDACLVTTVHPGTPTTLDRSSTFENLAYGLPASSIPGYNDNPSNPLIISDFFRGRGTNGWEFSVPSQDRFRDKNSKLMQALKNLAYFAGDPNGGAPSFTPLQVAGKEVHPYPSMAMWGDFSMLRRVLKLLDGGISYDNLSPADKTTLHTAGCTLGMLAYNLDYLEKLKVYDPDPTKDPTRLDPSTKVPVKPAMQSLFGYTNQELRDVLGAPKDANNNLDLAKILADPTFSDYYSKGLRGQIRLIDHISRGDIASTSAFSKVPKALLQTQFPSQKFIDSLKEIGTDDVNSGMGWTRQSSNNPEIYVRLLERWRDSLPTDANGNKQRDELNKSIYLAQLIITKEQVARDRNWGFQGAYGNQPYSSTANSVSAVPLGDCGDGSGSGSATNLRGWLSQLPSELPVSVNANVNGSSNVRNDMNGSDPLSRFCSHRPRYPILYSLFPASLSNITAPPASIDAVYSSGGFVGHQDISGAQQADKRTRDNQDNSNSIAKYIKAQNAGVNYTVIRPADIATIPLRLSLSGITLGSATQNWVLPYTAGTPNSGSTPNSNKYNLIKICGDSGSSRCSEPDDVTKTFQKPKAGTLVRIPFKDGAFYNGREMMSVRTLDLDLDLMRTSAYQGDLWLPKKGIIYAYREDAVSEAQIVRPNSGNTWNSCDTDEKLRSTLCTMKTADISAYDSKDPPVNADNSITPKPVDYYPDPDRRPYGFRLRQGKSLQRTGDEGRGLSFISDNPVYVQADFNLHQDSGGALLEEFTERLNYQLKDGGVIITNFYDRTTPDRSFADREKDQWRPSEVVADAVTLLSGNFCDGSIEDGIAFPLTGSQDVPAWARDRYGCGGSVSITSYLNQNVPTGSISNPATKRGVLWVRSNILDSFPYGVGSEKSATSKYVNGKRNIDEGESPIFISRVGRPVYWEDLSGTASNYNGTYLKTQEEKKLVAANDTRMNLIVVSGLVPSREGQSYGGLHNFPRFLESWGKDANKVKLFISGAFLQLNFSTYGTAPFDQEAWQPGAKDPTPGDKPENQWFTYYIPPYRLWGYDVALQYAKPGPVAERFQFAEDIRSEFYTEPPANDPYIRNLCLQVPGKTSANCPT